MRERKPIDRALRRCLEVMAEQAAATGPSTMTTNEAPVRLERMFRAIQPPI